MPTIIDVAKHAGVAPMTVSRVINNSGYVREETRERVERAIEALGYKPNVLARGLRGGVTETIGLILTDVANPFWTTVARGVEDAASAAGFNVFLCNTDESIVKQASYVQALLQKQVDGFLLVPSDSIQSGDIHSIQKAGATLVLMDRYVHGVAVDTIRCDSESSAYTLVKHLLDLGHQRIGMLSGPKGVSTAEERVNGYRRALTEAGIEYSPQYLVYGEYSQSSGYEMARTILQTLPRPTALFAANNFIAIGAVLALREVGFRVPKDMSVVAFDDMPQNYLITPFLTAAAQPGYKMGQRATQVLLGRLSGQVTGDAIHEVLPTEVIIRSSTAVPPARVRSLKNL